LNKPEDSNADLILHYGAIIDITSKWSIKLFRGEAFRASRPGERFISNPFQGGNPSWINWEKIGCRMLEEGLLQILDKVYEHRDLDFRQYKESTLKRRVERRLRATKVESYNQYINVLSNDPGEYTRLIDNLTIQVTEFFRNPEAWQVLREQVIPEIIERKKNSEIMNKRLKPGLRIWCAGCATGEEVYSTAILVDHLLDERKTDFEVIVCGTDIDDESLLKAEHLVYKSVVTKTVSEDIFNKYFHYDDGGYKVIPSLRKTVCFRHHNLVLDDPLKEMDLIVCRNVAIYFTRPLQEKIFMDFCNGLNGKGYLFLGKAETLIGPALERFKVINKRWRIYQKNDQGKKNV
jgi:chemotaxis methyl-accepting protein methylase